MKMNKISMNKRYQRKIIRNNFLKINQINKAKEMMISPINKIVMNNHHNNHWRLKTTQ